MPDPIIPLPDELPCPFCGSEAEAEPWHGGGPNKHMVRCSNEGCGSGCSFTGESLGEALLFWNKRHQTDDELLGAQFRAVWDRAVRNHRKYSASSPTAGNYHDIRFIALGLCGEAGELANVIKKHWRGDGALPLADAWNETADVFAYDIMLAHELDMSPRRLLQTVADKQDAFVAKMKALKHGR